MSYLPPGWTDDPGPPLALTPEEDREIRSATKWRVERHYDFTDYDEALKFWRAGDPGAQSILYPIPDGEFGGR